MLDISSKTFTLSHPLKTAVLFLIFNRPDTTKQVFEAIRQAKPPRLYVAADGPRADKSGESEKVEWVRRVATDVDWNCEVKTLFRDKNLGCRKAVSNAITWFFENEKEGIILEDDCLPSQSFLWFCEELLEKYRDDERVMVISGDNFDFGRKQTEYSYYFSRYIHTWGWASWRRTWKLYDVNMSLWPEVRDHGGLAGILGRKKTVRYWGGIFERVYRGTIDTWDYQLWFACCTQNGLCIIPNQNLISNIGFGSSATHTCEIYHKLAYLPVKAIQIPLQHPPYVIPNTMADNFIQDAFLSPNIVVKIKNKLNLSRRLNFKSIK